MILSIQFLRKMFYGFIVTVICCRGGLQAIKLTLDKVFYHNINTTDEIYNNLVYIDETLICFGGNENFPKLFSPNKDNVNKEKYTGEFVKRVAINPNNKIIGAIIEQAPEYVETKQPLSTCKIKKFKTIMPYSPRKISLVLCTENFEPFQKVDLGDQVPTKIYYTPNGSYLIALTFPSDDTMRENPCIQIIDPNKNFYSPIVLYKINLPQKLECSFGFDDYLLVTNDYLVYVSSHIFKNKDSHKNNINGYSRYFEIFRRIPEKPFIEKIESFQKDEEFYRILTNELNRIPGASPLHINPDDGFFLLHSQFMKCIKKCILSKKIYIAPKIDLKISDFDLFPIAIFSNKYLAFCKKDKEIELYDFDLKQLDEKQINIQEDGSLENIQFSNNGKKLIATTNKKVFTGVTQ